MSTVKYLWFWENMGPLCISYKVCSALRQPKVHLTWLLSVSQASARHVIRGLSFHFPVNHILYTGGNKLVETSLDLHETSPHRRYRLQSIMAWKKKIKMAQLGRNTCQRNKKNDRKQQVKHRHNNYTPRQLNRHNYPNLSIWEKKKKYIYIYIYIM